MKWYYIDVALMSTCGLFATVTVSFSAIGCEEVGMILLGIFLSALTTVVGSVLLGWRCYTHRPLLPALLGGLAVLGVIISAAVTQWPLRVTYVLSRSAFDSFAQRVRSGQHFPMPQRVGLFKIRKAEVYYNGIVCLWTEPAPSGNTGFVQCSRDRVPFNLWSIVRLDDGWQFISED